jgi:pimeloyl-ACP methyl ester carboxylesterase
MSVRIARRLASLGFVVVRFDHSGVGDSGIRRDRLTWSESTVVEARDVMNDLEQRFGVKRFILAGLCSGAVTAFKTACADERVVGVVMMNSQGLDMNSEWNRYVKNRSWARQYWRTSLLDREAWKRALKGKIQYRRLAKVLVDQIRDRVTPPRHVMEISEHLSRQLHALLDRRVRFLFVHSHGDHSLDYFDVFTGSCLERLRSAPGYRNEIVHRTDHTFTLLGNQKELLDAIADWFEAWKSQSVAIPGQLQSPLTSRSPNEA